MRRRLLFFFRKFRVSLLDFDERARFELIDQIVSLDAETFAPAHLDVRPRAILFAQLDPELFTSRGRQRHHLVTEVHARVLADLRHDRSNAARDDLLRIRLPRIDHVVDRHAAAEMRTISSGCFRLGLS